MVAVTRSVTGVGDTDYAVPDGLASTRIAVGVPISSDGIGIAGSTRAMGAASTDGLALRPDIGRTFDTASTVVTSTDIIFAAGTTSTVSISHFSVCHGLPTMPELKHRKSLSVERYTRLL
ncbi:MAG: hypothetical protein ACR2OF_00615 [Hyphomicrobium sp.]